MIAIFKREFKSYMHSVIGFLFMAITVFFVGLYATRWNIIMGYPYVSYTLSSVLFLFLLTIPILSMRILADDRKQKTDQLVLTAPVSVGKVVMGKYMSMTAIFLIPMAALCVYPLFLSRLGTVPMADSYTAIFAFILYGLTCIAIGMFISSLTESQVIAAVLSFGVLFLTYIMSGITSMFSTTENILTKFLSIFDFYTRFSNMIDGVLDITSVIYFVSIIILMLFLTTQSIQKRRYTISVSQLSMGAYSLVTVVVSIAIAVFVNLIAAKIPAQYTQIDVSYNKLYTITDQTKELLKGLDEDINIYMINSEDNADSKVKQTLDGYEDLSDHISVKYVDPLVNPKFASQYSSSDVSQNSLIVESSKRYKVISYNDLYETEIDYSTYSQNVTGYDAEGQITSAIAYVTDDAMPKIYMIAGHNEYSLNTGFLNAIEKENIDYETIDLIKYDSIPDDAECIIIDAPESDFSEDDANKVIDYLNNGGKAIIMAEYVDSELTNFNKILDQFGVAIQKGYAVDLNSDNYYQTPIYILPNIEYADETTGLTDQHSYIMAPYSQGISITDEDNQSVEYTKLLTCSEQSLVKTNVASANSFEKEDGDIDGPVCIGLKAEKELDSGSSVLYLFASAQMFTDNIDQAVSGKNKQLFTNIMSTVANHESSISIPVKSYNLGSLTVSTKDILLFAAIVVVLIPLALIICGLIIWIKRRKK